MSECVCVGGGGGSNGGVLLRSKEIRIKTRNLRSSATVHTTSQRRLARKRTVARSRVFPMFFSPNRGAGMAQSV